MLQIPLWSRILTLLIVVGGILVALPNALPEKVRSHLPGFLPRSTVSLGLDLQGGSYLLQEVDLPQVQKDKTEALIGDLRAALRKAKIGFTDLGANGDTVQVRITDMARYDEARTLIQAQNPTMSSAVLSVGACETLDGGWNLARMTSIVAVIRS